MRMCWPTMPQLFLQSSCQSNLLMSPLYKFSLRIQIESPITCKPLPYNLLGDAEQLIDSLVKPGVIAECHEPHGRGVHLVTDLWALNSNSNRLGWPFWASAELQKNILGDSKVYWTLDFLMDIFKCHWPRSHRIWLVSWCHSASTNICDCPRDMLTQGTGLDFVLTPMWKGSGGLWNLLTIFCDNVPCYRRCMTRQQRYYQGLLTGGWLWFLKSIWLGLQWNMVDFH